MNALQLACRTSSSRRLSVNGLSLHALEWAAPNAPGLCFLHGGSAHSHWFDGVIQPFVGRYHILALDQRGHGESEWPVPPAYATEDFVSDLLGVIQVMGWERMTLVGHSMGGAIALAHAVDRPQAWSGLVLSGPAVEPGGGPSRKGKSVSMKGAKRS